MGRKQGGTNQFRVVVEELRCKRGSGADTQNVVVEDRILLYTSCRRRLQHRITQE